MVSAVFHTPFDPETRHGVVLLPDALPLPVIDASAPVVVRPPRRPWRERIDGRALGLAVVPRLCGLGLPVLVWFVCTLKSSVFPGPGETFDAAVQLLVEAVERRGGAGATLARDVLASLEHAGAGFGLALLAGVPLGFLMARVGFLAAMVSPWSVLLGSVPPLVGWPIGLLLFARADVAAVGVVFLGAAGWIASATAAGIRAVPRHCLNVARLLDLSAWRLITRILLPAALPRLLRGARQAAGVAWMAAVAVEMLGGAAGIGSWAWREWQHGNVAHGVVAIAVIGAVGAIVDLALRRLERHAAIPA